MKHYYFLAIVISLISLCSLASCEEIEDREWMPGPDFTLSFPDSFSRLVIFESEQTSSTSNGGSYNQGYFKCRLENYSSKALEGLGVGIDSVSYYFDDKRVSAKVDPPYVFHGSYQSLSNGAHTIKALINISGENYNNVVVTRTITYNVK